MVTVENALTPFFKQAAAQPNKTAIVDGDGRSISYGDLADRSKGLAANLLGAGISAGDRVLLALPVTLNLYLAMAALWRLGSIIVFPEPALGIAGLKHAVNIAKPDAFLCEGKFKTLPWISKPIRSLPLKIDLKKHVGTAEDAGAFKDHPSEGEDPALISFTSGSTGIPKAISRTHKFLLAQNDCLRPLIGNAGPDDVDLVAFPVFVIANLAMGLTSVLPNWPLKKHDSVNPETVASLVRSKNITRVLVPPSICEHLVSVANPPSLNSIFTGGGPVFPDLLKDLAGAYPNADIVSVYGSTEAEPIAHQHYKDIPADAWEKMQSGSGLFAGTPVDVINLEIIDDEIIVTGQHVNLSYMNGVGDTENKLRRSGKIWHKTGDAGRLDAVGGLWLRGRVSAKAGAFYPFEVEVAARNWPGVKQAALIPGSDPSCLALAGDEPEAGVWESHAKLFPGLNITKLSFIPLDKRHRSKVDYPALEKCLRKLS